MFDTLIFTSITTTVCSLPLGQVKENLSFQLDMYNYADLKLLKQT